MWFIGGFNSVGKFFFEERPLGRWFNAEYQMATKKRFGLKTFLGKSLKYRTFWL
jgi:hypothetical protein